jgi:TPR repeat protein
MSAWVLNLVLPSFLLLSVAQALAIEPDQLSKIQADANAGDSAAQKKLGEALIKGDGVPKDIDAGIKLLEAAGAKNVWAKLTLASWFLNGTNLPVDKARAISLYEQAAAEKNAVALSALGMIYLNGNGVSADSIKGRDYLERAIALNDSGAKKSLGVALIRGQGIPKDVTLGTQLLQAATEKDVWAKITFAVMLMAGTELPADKSLAISLYEKAAVENNTTAMNVLGLIYLNGNGATADPVKGRAYLEKSIALGDPGGKKALGTALIRGQGLAKDVTLGTQLLQAASEKDVWAKMTLASMLLSGTELSADKSLAISLYEQAAAENNSGAMSALGMIYLNGNGVTADPAKGRDYLEKAIALGDAGMLMGGADLPSDKPSAVTLYEKAATANNTSAMTTLGMIYLNGNGVPADPLKGRAVLEKAIALGDIGAQKNLGLALIKGQGLPKDTETGLRLFESVAEKDINAKLALGQIYLKGEFVKQDIAKATALIQATADAGQTGGLEALGLHYLSSQKSAENERLAVKYLTQAGNLGRSSSWGILAASKLWKKLPHTKTSFEFYTQQARKSGNLSIETTVATRYLWGNGVPPSKKKFLGILEAASNKGNSDTTRTLIHTFRDGVPYKFQKNTKWANAYFQRYKSTLNDDQIKVETFLLKIASTGTSSGYKVLLNDSSNETFFQRPELQSQILAANRNFMVYRAQAGLQRGGIYKGPVTGSATKQTLQAMRQACKRMSCAPQMLDVNNLFHFATTW